MISGDNIDFWKNSLGLLPINLFTGEQAHQFILLNGGSGDICIDLNPQNDTNDYFSYAWSSNTKNFITIKNDTVNVYNWQKEIIDDYKLKIVQENISKFYEYLIKDSYKSDFDIVPSILEIYRKLRVETGEDKEGINAINQLLLLLMSIDDKDEIRKINLEDWGFPSNIAPIHNLDDYVSMLKNRSKVVKGESLKPISDLIRRHTAGQLFQEAQKDAIFTSREINLFGGYISDYELKVKLYSSLHYTPNYLSRSIVEFSLSRLNLKQIDSLKILDPACGSSEFLLELLKQLKSNGFKGKVEINGWEISETAINISRFLLNYEKIEWGDRLIINIRKVDNSLTEKWDDNYDLILMNPPFLSWELMNKSDREIISEVFSDNVKMKPNLASAFIFKSIKHLKKDGIIGTVMPSSILLMDTYDKLRKFMQDELNLLLLGKLGNYVFEEALTDASIMIGRKNVTSELPLLLWSKNEKGYIKDAFRDLRKINYGKSHYVKENKYYNIYIPDIYPVNENWKIISYKEQDLKKHLDKLVIINKLKYVKDIFNVHQGIRLGSKVFKISKDYYEKLPKNERKYFRPAIDNDSIKKGKLSIESYVWFPYNSNGVIFDSENDFNRHAPIFYKLLSENKQNLVKRAGINSWFELTRPRNWQFSANTKLVSTEFGKAGSFAFDEKGIFAVERGNAWIPKKEFKSNDEYYFYLAIFNSPFFDKLLSIYSKQLAGGSWYDLGKKYTADIPIPVLSDKLKASEVYNKFVDFGKQICLGEMLYFDIIDDYLKKYIYNV